MKKAGKLCDACTSKSVSQKAIAWCSVCEEAYCDTCEANHRTYKMAQNHKIVPIKDISEDTPISNICAFVACDKHPDKTMKYTARIIPNHVVPFVLLYTIENVNTLLP
ncbi:Hypothetical predicted protein [Mytilus galloprovincialis]|nr:Hypothetical predicted protein [Mytilus galloprovincialis]